MLFTIVALGLAIGAIPMRGQTISFFSHFSASGMDNATAVAADSSGIYVFGNGPDRGAWMRKFDSMGNVLWTREFSSPAVQVFRAQAAATGVYVLGFGGPTTDFVLRKYSAAGDELWTAPVEVSAGALAADATGVYVAGGNYQSALLRKYSPDGTALWTRQFGAIQTATGVAVDATGVYVQVTYSNGAAGVVVRKYDSGGSELWTRQLNPSDVHRTFAAAVPAGFYVVAADAYGSGTYLRKYDSEGNEVRSRHLDSSDLGGSIAVDAGGVYVAGQVPPQYAPNRPYTALPGQCRSASGGDSFVRKYDPDGMEIWTRQFGTTDAAWANGVAVDDSGVYVVGAEGTALVRNDTEHIDAFAPANPTSGAFLIKLEKTAAVMASGPRIFPDCVVNAASYVGGGVAPGEMVTIFGSSIGPSELVPAPVAEDLRLPATLAETRVMFNGMPAPLLYVSDQQSSAIVPYEVAGQASVDVQVEYKGTRSDAITVPVLPSRPGIFSVDGSGWGQALIRNQDGSLNSPSNPAERGSVITLFATGGGEAAPGVQAGEILGAVLPQTSLPLWVFFDLTDNEFQEPSKAAEILRAASAAVAGLLQVDLRVPANAVRTGNAVPFLLIIGSHWTVYQVTVALR